MFSVRRSPYRMPEEWITSRAANNASNTLLVSASATRASVH
jgi:hypothetical protein